MPGIRLVPRGPFRILPALAAAAFLSTAFPAESPPSHPSAEREALFEAYRKGMPLDSLYYRLAGQALGGLAFDTAMVFNLSIPTPKPGPFRDSVLSQRYRLYLLAGLSGDAAALKDSLPASALPVPPRRKAEWTVRSGGGYYHEDQGIARNYPSGAEAPGVDTGGWLASSHGSLGLPLPSPDALPLVLDLGYDLVKTYYKDSLDYRAGAGLRTERILDGLSAGISAEAGRLSGVGAVTAWQGDLTWIAPLGSGWWLGHAGYGSEWEGFRDNRYHAAWISLLREWSFNRGFSLQASLSGTMSLQEPFQVPGMGKVIFVDDVSKSQPVHFRDRTFQDTVPRGSPITAFLRYSEARDSTAFRCSQDVFTVRPGIALGLPAAAGFRTELGLSYAFAWYPEEYSWLEDRDPEPVPGDSVEFRGYALNRADGRHYRAFMDSRSGGFDEYYGTVPLRERSLPRRDHRLGAGITVSRRTLSWGEFRFEAEAERTFSSLEGISPVWIPEWEYGATLRWSLSGRKSP